MLDVYQRAIQARQLQDYEPFKEIAKEIQDEAVKLFLNPSSDINSLTRAHEAVRAVETFYAVIQSRIDAETIAERKAQHRGND
jgi:hypothetical protein